MMRAIANKVWWRCLVPDPVVQRYRGSLSLLGLQGDPKP